MPQNTSSRRREIPSPYLSIDRDDWARLRQAHPMSLTDEDVSRLSGVGEPLDLHEVEAIYLPLSRLLTLYAEGTGALHSVTSEFLGERPARTPFVIGVAGSVAVGKSTTARILRELMSRWPSTPTVQLITTDGFLYPNAELERRGISMRKGFPESYDQRALVKFVSDVKAGIPDVRAPVYSHHSYDIVPGEYIEVGTPDVLIVEGLNVLQPPRTRADGSPALALSDFFDFSVYVDATDELIRQWYVDRFLRLREVAFNKPEAFFSQFARLSDEEAQRTALEIWNAINQPNLVENIAPTRGRASLVLVKGPDHRIDEVLLRKL